MIYLLIMLGCYVMIGNVIGALMVPGMPDNGKPHNKVKQFVKIVFLWPLVAFGVLAWEK